MSDPEKKCYSYWKEKYKTSLRQLEKMPEHPAQKEFSLEDAKLLDEGEFWVEEEDEVSQSPKD